jgi:hypothetical protein
MVIVRGNQFQRSFFSQCTQSLIFFFSCIPGELRKIISGNHHHHCNHRLWNEEWSNDDVISDQPSERQVFTTVLCTAFTYVQLFCAYVLGLYFTGVSQPAQKLRVEHWWNWALNDRFSPTLEYSIMWRHLWTLPPKVENPNSKAGFKKQEIERTWKDVLVFFSNRYRDLWRLKDSLIANPN